MDVILCEPDAERVVPLRRRGGCIVPRGTWRQQLVREPSEFIFITPGRGTQVRPA
ncbi:MAG: hypothetical protein M0Q87_14420 [Ottowia sp.]|nr:hypothetical protein [Ottowia sp.]